ncbi:hypothetical protein DQ04_04491070 [Trypanosoma grayi]|uniref:hypothetical protein n=1 Tax=Trypanosoma grayi TaxID=71804 RepID=UPI0004F4911E|nr:hypothetical protein DQ04_04491070 [Trypanosoma grayi]KEG09889.1 hypothetical protein DQ04_04491070 [Trypanosoma grayi]
MACACLCGRESACAKETAQLTPTRHARRAPAAAIALVVAGAVVRHLQRGTRAHVLPPPLPPQRQQHRKECVAPRTSSSHAAAGRACCAVAAPRYCCGGGGGGGRRPPQQEMKTTGRNGRPTQ